MRRRIAAVLLGLVVMMGGPAAVMAWTYLGTYTGTVTLWGPVYGEKWGEIITLPGYQQRWIRSEGWNLDYTNRAVPGSTTFTSTVFHAFQQNTNCYLHVHAVFWWTNYPSPETEFKYADCAGGAGF
jgi:hypothetical protein